MDSFILLLVSLEGTILLVSIVANLWSSDFIVFRSRYLITVGLFLESQNASASFSVLMGQLHSFKVSINAEKPQIYQKNHGRTLKCGRTVDFLGRFPNLKSDMADGHLFSLLSTPESPYTSSIQPQKALVI